MAKPYRAEVTGTMQPMVYDPSEVRAVMNACGSTPTGRRDRLAIMLMWAAGLPPRDVCALALDAYDYAANTIRVGGRIIHVPKAQQKEMWAAIKLWSKDRAGIATKKSPLICNLNGHKLDPSYLRRMLPKLAKTAGVSRRFHAQGLRQTFAAAMYQKEVPVEIIRQQLGHSDIAFTASYLNRICPRKTFKAMDNFSLE